MLHVLHDFFSFARRPAGPPNLHATYATRLFRLPSSPRRTPDFTCYKCYATFRCFPSSPAGPPLLHATCATRLFACSRSLGTAPHSTCYMCSLAFFDSSTLGREPPHSTCYLCYLPFFDCPGKGPHFPRYRGFGFSDSLVHAAYACLSCSTCSIQINVPSSVYITLQCATPPHGRATPGQHVVSCCLHTTIAQANNIGCRRCTETA